MAGAAFWVHFAAEAPLDGNVGWRWVPSNGERYESPTKRASDWETKARRGRDGLSGPLTQPHTHYIWKLFSQDRVYSLGWSTPTGVTCLALTSAEADVIFFFHSFPPLLSFGAVTGG